MLTVIGQQWQEGCQNDGGLLPQQCDGQRVLGAGDGDGGGGGECHLPLELGAYLHVSDETATEVLVVGMPQTGAAVLLVG